MEASFAKSNVITSRILIAVAFVQTHTSRDFVLYSTRYKGDIPSLSAIALRQVLVKIPTAFKSCRTLKDRSASHNACLSPDDDGSSLGYVTGSIIVSSRSEIWITPLSRSSYGGTDLEAVHCSLRSTTAHRGGIVYGEKRDVVNDWDNKRSLAPQNTR